MAQSRCVGIVFHETTVTTKHLGEGIGVGFDAEDHLAGIEVLDAAARPGGKDTLRRAILEGLALRSN